MKPFAKNIIWAVIALVIISVVFAEITSDTKEVQKITLSELSSKIESGEVEKISVSGNTIEISLKNGEAAETQKEGEAGITQTLKNFGVSEEKLRGVEISVTDESGSRIFMTTVLPILLPLLIMGVFLWMLFKQAKGGVNQAFTFGKSNMRLSNFGKDKTTFKDVAGLKEAKEELIEIVDFLKNPKKFLDLGARIPRGVLLFGPPGTGKTLLARAVAGEASVPFFSMSASEFVEMFVGVGASRTRDAFAVAKKAAPAIIFIDEIDAVGRQRGAGMGGGNDEREQTLNQILVELDGFDRDTQVIVIAATNRPDVLDPALLRPGRFDRHVILDLPDIKDREEILKIHSKDKPLAPGIDFKKISQRTPGFSGADLANLMNEAALMTARKNKKIIEEREVLDSVEKVILGPERKSRTISQKEKEITAYHEGGHALVSASLKESDPVHKISIISRGMAGGYTLKLPEEDRRLKTRSQFLNDLAMMLGGFVSEKITFGDVTTGASNDLKEATALARKLVTKYGMSEKMGPVTFGNTEEMIFLGREMTTERNYSEEIAKQIDAEVSKFIHDAYDTATKVLLANKKALQKIAETLIEKETIEKEEFQELLKPFKIRIVTA